MTEKTTEALIAAFLGLGAVFTVMALLAAVLTVLNALSIRRKTSYAAEVERFDEAGEEVIDEEIIAVISAALTAALGKAPAIKHVKLGAEYSSWAAVGRQMVMSSHNLQKK